MTSVQRTPWPFPTPAARPSPAGVRERLLRQPRGSRLTEIEFRGADRDTVVRAASARAISVDQYRSPAVQAVRLDGDEWVCVLRYYAVD
ncbi:hypothetical protein LMG19282_04222 [Cupriavidus campinensis]|uniref:hypothetical protein n=1 Tax=Cupriavidus campinensis TaxID=151783 RepID=UPI001B03E7E8|nr:hypothetical protein [Cupriavidus campinensis]CAG2152582.1 hypothetical protein LMG19282_04222 [Cupriavidus campinensis]